MKKIIKFTKILLVLFAFNTNLYAQFCETELPQQATRSQLGNYIQQALNSNSNDTPMCINIFYHIVRDNNGYTTFDTNHLDMITTNLNEVYSKYYVYINSLGYDFINNTDFYDLTYTLNNNDDIDNYDRLVQINEHSNAIDIYIVNSITNENGRTLSGKANGIPSKAFAITNNVFFNRIPGHELGHCLGLMHTHETRYGDENVARYGDDKNCDVAGDLLCDTPADPGLRNYNGFLVNSNCEYIGNATDPTGAFYQPDTHNMMSYTAPVCLSSFSPSQVAIMRYNIANALSAIQSSSCININISDNVTCENSSVTLNLQGVQSNVTWDTSSNVIVNSSNNNQITIHANNNNENGIGYVTAYFGLGKSIKKEFWVGKPDYILERNHYAPGDEIGSEIIIKPQQVKFDKQGVNSINWQTIAGNGILAVDSDNMGASGDGNSGWWIRGKSQVYNRCGVNENEFILFDHSINCNNQPNNIYLIHINNNQYQVINPCKPTEKQIVTSAEIYDIYGVKISDITHQEDKIELNNSNNGQIIILKANTTNNQTSKTIQH